MARYIHILCLVLVLTMSLVAQNTISISIDKDTVLVGDQFEVDLVLRASQIPDIASIDFMSWRVLENLVYQQDTTLLEKTSPAEIIGTNEWQVTDNYLSTPVEAMEGWFDNSNTISKKIKISIYDIGVFTIPAPVIVSKTGKQYPIMQSARIMVLPANLGAIQDSIGITAIKPIMAEPTSWKDYMIYFYILAFVLIAPFLIKYLFGKKKESEQEELIPEIIIPAHEKALTALHTLRNQELWQEGKIKKYQSSLTDIVRRYLEDRFEVNALEMTTDEITRSLKDKDFDTTHSSTLERILQIADLVKFAKAKPPEDINEQFMKEAISFVNSTKKIEVEPADD